MLINIAQSSPSGPSLKRPQPTPNSKASSSASNPLKRQRRFSGKRSESPAKDGDPKAAGEEDRALEEPDPTQYVNREGSSDELGENGKLFAP